MVANFTHVIIPNARKRGDNSMRMMAIMGASDARILFLAGMRNPFKRMLRDDRPSEAFAAAGHPFTRKFYPDVSIAGRQPASAAA